MWMRTWRNRGESFIMTAFSRRIDGVGSGISYHHETTFHVCRGRMNVIYYQDNVLRNHTNLFFHQHAHISETNQLKKTPKTNKNSRAHTSRVRTMSLCLNGQHCPLIYRQQSIFVGLLWSTHLTLYTFKKKIVIINFERFSEKY